MQTTEKYDVYGVGAALVDTEVRISEELLRNIALPKGRMTLIDGIQRTELLTRLAVELREAKYFCGGSAANTVISVSRFGGRCFFACRTADDEDGKLYRLGLQSAGIVHNGISAPDSTTGKCLVLLTPDAERTMASFLGASENFCISDLDTRAVAEAEWVYMEGYLSSRPNSVAAAVHAYQLARRNGTRIALSFSDPNIVENFRSSLAQMLGEGVDLLFCNEQEALGWSGTHTLERALPVLRTLSRQIVITRGAKGSIFLEGEKSFDIAAPPVRATDTSGAGDTFAGAWMFAITRGYTPQQAGRLAADAASQVVTQYGPTLSRQKCEEIRHRNAI